MNIYLNIHDLFSYLGEVGVSGHLPRGRRSGEGLAVGWRVSKTVQLTVRSLPLTNTFMRKTEAWHLVIMVCLPEANFVHSVRCQWEVLCTLQRSGGLSPEGCFGLLGLCL